MNTPGFDGFPLSEQVAEVKFEVALYSLLEYDPQIPVSRLYHFRLPKAYEQTLTNDPPGDITGRRLMVFEKTKGECNIWKTLDSRQTVISNI